MAAGSSGGVSRLSREKVPEGAREALLAAARAAFAESGLEGARVDEIARRAGVNKQLVYHYFSSKDGLYTAVLEQVYREIRHAESGLALEAAAPEDAMRRLIEFSFDYLLHSPDFVRILSDENAHRGRHLHGSAVIEQVNRPIIELIRKTLARGEAVGVFRRGLDPLQVYLSIAGMSFFFFSNIHTISRAFGASLNTIEGIAKRRSEVVDFAMNALRPR
jgi:TetR/AcrR family transcriptional regulator